MKVLKVLLSKCKTTRRSRKSMAVSGGEMAALGGEVMTNDFLSEPFLQLLFSPSSVLVQFKPRFRPV
ncbi:hypothetical protein [Desertivirga brevis]|uniref:hypothetical protein n=1 Tax=Desertivirga brevis TaxID=2810310 RepID=UPI001A95EDB8|nr:hypothetical protein [Pedobacter sp. SYSU D00873]